MEVSRALNFLKNSEVKKKQIFENISYFNKKLPQRFIFVKIRKHLKNFLDKNSIEPRMLGIAGIRGVGKTTLLWHIADYIKNNNPDVKVYYMSMDIALSYDFKSSDLIEAIERLNHKELFVLLFDKVQYLPKWDLMLKIIYDKFKNTFIVATGSSSISLKSSVDLSSRWNVESLYPLSFQEFVLITSYLKTGKKVFPEKGLSERLKDVIFYSIDINDFRKKIFKLIPMINRYFNLIGNIKAKKGYSKVFSKNMLREYIFYRNIPRLLLIEDKKVILERMLDMVMRVINSDIKEFYDENELSNINKLLFYLPFTDEFNVDSLAKNLGLKKERIIKIVDSLIKAEILIKFPLSGGIKTRILKSEKIFFISPTIRYSILRKIYENEEKKFYSKLYEDIVALYLMKHFRDLTFYVKEADEKTPDLIVNTNSKPIAIEVGTSKTSGVQVSSGDFRYGISFKCEE